MGLGTHQPIVHTQPAADRFNYEVAQLFDHRTNDFCRKPYRPLSYNCAHPVRPEEPHPSSIYIICLGFGPQCVCQTGSVLEGIFNRLGSATAQVPRCLLHQVHASGQLVPWFLELEGSGKGEFWKVQQLKCYQSVMATQLGASSSCWGHSQFSLSSQAPTNRSGFVILAVTISKQLLSQAIITLELYPFAFK